MTDGNSGVSGVGDGEMVAVGVGVEVLPTLKVAEARASVTPLVAAAEIV